MRNGYGKSLFKTEDGECYICGYVGDTARHEIFNASNRQISKRLGTWIAVCPRCHNEIHADINGRFLWLKEEAQSLFMDEYCVTADEFRKVFGRNYL